MTVLAPEPGRSNTIGVWLFALVFALTLIGYPVAGVASSALGLSSLESSIPLRAFVVLLAFVLILHVIGARQTARLAPLILLFWWIYLIRLFWDLGTGEFDRADQALLFFIGTVVIPVLAIMIGAIHYDERVTARVTFAIGAFVCAASLAMNYLGIGEAADLTETTGRLSTESLNPITLGHVAVTTIIAALVLWKQPGLPGGRLALLGGGAVALGCLVLAASRGPILALMVVVISYAALRGRWGRIFAGGLAVLIVAPMILATQGVAIVERFTNITSDLSAIERLIIQGNALDQGLANPVIGSAYVELSSGQYPHNLILESLMALGFVGLLIFLFVCAQGGYRAFWRLRTGEVLVPLLLVQYFVAAMFSGSLWGAGPLWAVLMMLAVRAGSHGTPPFFKSSPASP